MSTIGFRRALWAVVSVWLVACAGQDVESDTGRDSDADSDTLAVCADPSVEEVPVGFVLIDTERNCKMTGEIEMLPASTWYEWSFNSWCSEGCSDVPGFVVDAQGRCLSLAQDCGISPTLAAGLTGGCAEYGANGVPKLPDDDPCCSLEPASELPDCP